MFIFPLFLMRVLILLAALLLDALLGDPPNKFHPVAWMGSLIYFLKKHAPRASHVAQLLYGLVVVLVGVLLPGLIGWGLEVGLAKLFWPLQIVLGGLVLKSMLSFKKLRQVGAEIQAALDAGEIVEARRLVSWHLVSRDTSSLSEAQLAAATIESIAENTTDSLISPLFYFLLFGLPGALVYRYANTADAIFGYRTPALEWLGKIPARFDDLLNLIPARLTVLLFFLAAAFPGFSLSNALKVWWHDRYKTTSPNAGHTMGAAAGALGIQLEKGGVYRLGGAGRLPVSGDIARVARLTALSVWAVVIAAAGYAAWGLWGLYV